MRLTRGMTLIDVVIGTALVVVIFSGLFGLLRASVLVSTLVQTESTAAAIANNEMEQIRALPYDSVGTVGGIPSGTLPQNATTTEDGINYGVRTFIEYYDDPADGTGTSDTNGITTDYKIIKVTVRYPAGKSFNQLSLISDYTPQGIETTTGGGTLEVFAVNAAGSPVSGATVQITDASTSPTVNLTTFTNAQGEADLPGAATSTQYAITVTKSGYSTAQTYARTQTNQNPSPGYLTVVKNQTTSGTFAIDLLGTLTLNSYLPAATSTFTDAFADTSKLAATSGTSVSGGMLQLSGGSTAGTAVSTLIAPSNLTGWGSANATTSSPAGTTVVFHIVDSTDTLIPDSVLPGNSSGFTSSVNLSSLSIASYPSLALSASLSSTNASSTPLIDQWSLSYGTGPTPLPNVGYTLTGAKTIGTTGGGAPIYKTSVTGTTGSSGSSQQTLEWDSYALAVSGYDVIDACSAPPYALSPGAAITESLTLGSSTPNSLLANVTDSSGNVLSGASVTLSRSGYSKTVTTSACGNAYFGSLTAASDYSVMIQDTGYTTNTNTGVSVSGSTFYADSF